MLSSGGSKFVLSWGGSKKYEILRGAGCERNLWKKLRKTCDCVAPSAKGFIGLASVLEYSEKTCNFGRRLEWSCLE